MIEKTIEKRSLVKGLYIMQGVLLIGWLAYLISFYLFYKEAYFYVDKRLSLFLRMLSFLNSNFDGAFVYFVLSFFLFTFTMLLAYFLFFISKKTKRHEKLSLLFICLDLFLCLSLLINVNGFIFAVILILAASLVYIMLVLTKVSLGKEVSQYEEGDVIEIKGPFGTEKEAQEEVISFLKSWSKAKVVLDKDIYLDSDNKYYADIFVEAIKE
ncbi:hypothetical protein [Enterococcus crotali]|uniref:hypothetical protein n=1 Tax=Enterococcus crotali TaxID=1453587 RepID=UPI0004A7FB8C|nr:hypothetical protein [Enterococcus crotali]OTP50026.1 hypothetical protein A5881_001441 [Enterococcus termitis]